MFRRYRSHQKKSSKKSLSVFLSVLLATTSIGFVYTARLQAYDPINGQVLTLKPTQAEAIDVRWPKTGQAAIGSLEQGVLTSASKTQRSMPIASMTKVFTALAILDKRPFEINQPGFEMTIKNSDIKLYKSYLARGGSVYPVALGQEISQHQAIQIMLISSANNIADSLAIQTFGSMNEFLSYANNMIKDMGLKKTILADASGFSSNSISTADEMIIAGQALLNNPVLAKIVATKQLGISNGVKIENTNKLLADQSIIGIKTGTTDEAGSCLLFAANYKIEGGPTTKILGVVMGQPSHEAVFSNTRSILEQAYKGFGKITVADAQVVVGRYNTPWGTGVEAKTDQPLSIYGWKGRSYQPKAELNNLVVGNEQHTEVGTLSPTNSPNVSSSVPVYTASPSAKPPFSWRLRHILEEL